MHKGTFPRPNCSARKHTLVHHRTETLRAEKIGALSDSRPLPVMEWTVVERYWISRSVKCWTTLWSVSLAAWPVHCTVAINEPCCAVIYHHCVVCSVVTHRSGPDRSGPSGWPRLLQHACITTTSRGRGVWTYPFHDVDPHQFHNLMSADLQKSCGL